ncbi:hypothetical protein [Bacillus thuringiensis]|uniref:hypothetical protein n=1 Tax=Bacillus thuringiensis TaxID=1428 RepID=UPI000BF93E9F|nr:hypothetical protein [Bacillus thuringiensis]PFK62324.1 hypothetical protein COJ09_06725 [Bacillus thuringiensis]
MFKNRNIPIIFIAIIILLVLSTAAYQFSIKKAGLNNNKITSEIKKEPLYARIDKLEYRKSEDKLDITLSTNFLDFTFANVTIYDSTHQKVTQTSATIMNGRFNAPADTYKASIEKGEYYAVLSVDVDKESSFLSNRKVIEQYGNAHDISTQQKGNDRLTIKTEANDKFSIYISTNNKIPIDDVSLDK